jgi:hypothetical protein
VPSSGSGYVQRSAILVAVQVGVAGAVVVAAETRAAVLSRAIDAQETSVVFIMNECIGELNV